MGVGLVRQNVIKDKSFLFAVRAINLSNYLQINKREYVISKQLLRSGTSVGAMIREAEYAETKNDFKHKLGIAQKEINETMYWLELLKITNYIDDKQFNSLHNEATEILKLTTSILRSVKLNIKREL